MRYVWMRWYGKSNPFSETNVDYLGTLDYRQGGQK